MASPLLLLLLSSVFVFSAGAAQDGGDSVSSITPAPISNMNQTSATQPAKQRGQSTANKIEYIEEDYIDDEDEDATVAHTSPFTKVSCRYDRCQHLTPSCEEIQRHAGGKCLCPGIDGPEYKPDAPPLKDVLLGETQMTVKWCSPSSTVHGYRVLYGEPGGALEQGPYLNASFRTHTIDNLHPGSIYTVCVVAYNEAGESPVDEEEDGPVGPCKKVHTTMQSLYIGIGIGLLALAGLLIILGYFLWRCKKNKSKRQANLEESGISNYTYKAGSVDRL